MERFSREASFSLLGQSVATPGYFDPGFVVEDGADPLGRGQWLLGSLRFSYSRVERISRIAR